MGSLRSLLKKEPAPIRYEICLNASQSQFCLDWSTVSFDKLSEAEAQAKRWKCPPLSYYKTITEISKEYNNAFICMWGGDGVTPYCGGSYSAPTFTSSAVTQDCSIKGTFSQIQLWPGTK